jgi:hypothetical protein
MALDSGKKVFYKTMPEVVLQQATVVASDGDTIVLDIEGKKDIAAGQQLMISADGSQYFAEVVSLNRDAVRVRKTWSNSRSYFRVDDVVQLVARKVPPGESVGVSRSFPFSEIVAPASMDAAVPDVSPRVWQMLVNIHTMLGMVLERLDMETEGFLHAEKDLVLPLAQESGLDAGLSPEVPDFGRDIVAVDGKHRVAAVVRFRREVGIEKGGDPGGSSGQPLHHERLPQDHTVGQDFGGRRICAVPAGGAVVLDEDSVLERDVIAVDHEAR